MEALKSANVVLRFLLELCALAALAYWGATAKVQLAGRIALAIGIPLIAAVVWALIVAPRAPVDLGSGARLAVELLVFAAAIAALASRHQIVLAVILAVVYVINRSLIAIWHQ